MIKIKRAYDVAASGDEQRILVDRLWPRGISKEDLKITAWLKDVAPSNELRRWFSHDPRKWSEFQRRYFVELDAKPETLQPIRQALEKGQDVTLIYGARDTEHNNAVALKRYLEES